MRTKINILWFVCARIQMKTTNIKSEGTAARHEKHGHIQKLSSCQDDARRRRRPHTRRTRAYEYYYYCYYSVYILLKHDDDDDKATSVPTPSGIKLCQERKWSIITRTHTYGQNKCTRHINNISRILQHNAPPSRPGRVGAKCILFFL